MSFRRRDEDIIASMIKRILSQIEPFEVGHCFVWRERTYNRLWKGFEAVAFFVGMVVWEKGGEGDPPPPFWEVKRFRPAAGNIYLKAPFP